MREGKGNIEAYTAITGNGYAFPFGIYDDDTPVGFLMVGYDTDDYWEDAPAIANGNYNLWRLMIDKRYQGKGYGRKLSDLHWTLSEHGPVARLIIAGCRTSLRMVSPASFTARSVLQKPANMTGKK